MPGCYYSPAGYLPVTYFSSPTLLQSEWANGQVRSSHVKTPVASSLVEPTTSALRVTIKMADRVFPSPSETDRASDSDRTDILLCASQLNINRIFLNIPSNILSTPAAIHVWRLHRKGMISPSLLIFWSLYHILVKRKKIF